MSGSSKILVFVAVSLLMVFRHPLLMEKSDQGVNNFFSKVCCELCCNYVSKPFRQTDSLAEFITQAKSKSTRHMGFRMLLSAQKLGLIKFPVV